MFAGLHAFEDEAFFNKNTEIKLYTADGMRIYEIVAAYVRDDRNILYDMVFSDDAVWADYIENDMFGRHDLSVNLKQRDIGPKDQVIALSTCVSGEDEQRYIVQGVLKKEAA
jgi:sortase B